jgi:hypothetical protein
MHCRKVIGRTVKGICVKKIPYSTISEKMRGINQRGICTGLFYVLSKGQELINLGEYNQMS